MRNIWAPWRFKYITQQEKEEGCLFCRVSKKNEDEKNLIIARKEHCFLMLNLYPYNNGHLMISPYVHVATLDALPKEQLIELFDTVSNACANIRTEMKPDGFNIGLNIGSVAGAGVAEHLHVHVVPRWAGDTNFMPVIGNVKVISEALEDTYKKLKKYEY
ncbi:MAG TPA: HIT domain-containing protein [Candidatus Deferrimicrobium sp.]|nr:HIT domain-containing protein [Candidatus Deferrimicrobium sp.]